jgi:hypothetical protein
MANRTLNSLVILAVAQAFVGCDGYTPSAPAQLPPGSQPSQPTDSYTLANVTLSGVVFEETSEGRTPIEGVEVYCEPCGAETHTWASTDADGFYSFTGVWTNPGQFPTRILIRKDGYGDPEGLPKPTPPNPSGAGWREVVVNGDTRFDVQLVRR